MVVIDHEGNEVFRAGGCWDAHLEQYVDRECKAHVVQLEESQLEVARAFARWMASSRANLPDRIRALFAGGERGSGKTYFMAGIVIVACALAWPKCCQFAINITTKNKRECQEAIRSVARPQWIRHEYEDPRDPRMEFVNGSFLGWLTSLNPDAIRQGGLPIRNILVNEGQSQSDRVFINAIGSIRNVGAIVTVATNPPQNERADWVARVWQAILAKKLNGAAYRLETKKNRRVDQAAVDDIGEYLRVVSPEAWAADAMGQMTLSGPIAYPSFKALEREFGGHIGTPPAHWIDVTLELTARAIGSEVGYPFVCGVDFQRRPGIIGVVAKIYRDPERGVLVAYAIDTIGVRGVEPDFSHALAARGYVPTHGMAALNGSPGAPILLIGDGTGAKQNSVHDFSKPPSFEALAADGWITIPPDTHWKTGKPTNPFVKDSRAQMYTVFAEHMALIAPACAEANEGFPSLLESLRSAKVGPKGGLVDKGDFQHSPDGFRYLCWVFLPRPRPPGVPFDGSDIDLFRGFRLTEF